MILIQLRSISYLLDYVDRWLKLGVARKKTICIKVHMYYSQVESAILLEVPEGQSFAILQPALLYIVPGVIGFLGVHCAIRGEIKPVSAFYFSILLRFYLPLFWVLVLLLHW